ncbi:MAG TPA: hypothetical protein PKD04_05305 [Rhodocyclaceae bacterium]|jgi:hypothetical protein|nr:DNA primase [Betaproteobacteria bacterium]HMV00478.1 hypothetical protein [Rhodocyclaceae bacterium]HMV20574.1 hypothetical protein [Rhodocyclaceae bacterium]HMW77137.1 hypothetical protein [Rhodocyclaceae bacterium]HNE41739.1 hypothetical protein [Rhodocyclaceae bacterium]
MGADLLLSRLERVRKTGPDSWQARCPAHDDLGPSLTIRETEGATVLVHCFAGCSVHEVVGAAGLQIGDLFPPRQHHGKPERRPFPAADALRAVAFEALVVAAAGSALLAGQAFTPADRERLILAVGRIQAAASAVLPNFRRARHG